MSFKSADPATSVATCIGWTGIAVYSFWIVWSTNMNLLLSIPIGLMLALAAGGYAIESLSQELTVRRWAISQLVFTVMGVVFLIAGIFDSQIFIARWLLVLSGVVYVITAALCAMAAKDLF
jgi:hypothetical protein